MCVSLHILCVCRHHFQNQLLVFQLEYWINSSGASSGPTDFGLCVTYMVLYDLNSMPTTVFAFKLEHVIGAIQIDTGQSFKFGQISATVKYTLVRGTELTD